MSHSVLSMTRDLVMAQIATRRLSPNAVQQALVQTHAHLLRLHQQEQQRDPPPSPIDWQRSITLQTVTCLVCGMPYKQLSWHHLRTHGLDGKTYRATYGIPRTQALTARSVTEKRQLVARRTRPWEQAPQNRKTHRRVKAKRARTRASPRGRRITR